MSDPASFNIGPIPIHIYGLFIATGVLLAGLLGSREAKRRGEDPEIGWSMLLPVLVLAVLGARIYHVIHQWGYYSQNPELILAIWNGGLGIPGAVAGGAVAILAYCRWKKLNTLRWLDIFASATLLGQAIGRLGNFFNQELYGPPTSLPWGIPIDAAHRIGEWTDLSRFPEATTRFHPLFAYEAVLNLVGLAIILWVSRRFAHRLYDGDVLLMYLMWYGLVRTYLETFRVQNWIILGVPTAIWLGIIAFVGGGLLLWLRHVRGWGTPGAWMREHRTDGVAGSSPDAASEPSAG